MVNISTINTTIFRSYDVTDNSVTTDEAESEVSIKDTPGSDKNGRQCLDCGKFFKGKGGWYWRHKEIGKCVVLPAKTSDHQPNKNQKNLPNDTERATEKAQLANDNLNLASNKKKCPNCDKIISVNGGWYTKHIQHCLNDDDAMTSEATASVTSSIEDRSQSTVSSEDDNSYLGRKRQCKKCHQVGDNKLVTLILRPVVIIVFTHVRPFVPTFQNLTKQIQFHYCTGETVDLADWIIDDTCLVCFNLFHFVYVTK